MKRSRSPMPTSPTSSAACRRKRCIARSWATRRCKRPSPNIAARSGQDDHEEGALLCKCFGVDEGVIERAVRVNKLTTPEQVTFYTKAGGGCLTCFEQIEGLLARVNADMVEEGTIAAAQAYRVGSVDPRTLKSKPRVNGAANGAPKPAASAAQRCAGRAETESRSRRPRRRAPAAN